MAVTQSDIARRLGVSQRLVSYALNGHRCVGDEMRRRILKEANDLGYRPHRAAQALVTGRTFQVALCLPILGSSFNNEIIRHFEMLARPTAYDLLIATFDPGGRGAGSLQYTADATIFVGPDYAVPKNMPAPLIVIQAQLEGKERRRDEFDRVQIDTMEASYAVMRHLLEQGCRRIAYVAPEGMMNPHDYRCVAHEACMKEAGLPVERIALPIYGEELIRQFTHQTLLTCFEQQGFPDALFCCNDDIGMGAYRALQQLGRPIPGGTAVVGFDDLDHARYLHPPMSSVYMPVEAVCRRAWELALQRIDNAEFPPVHERFAAHLVVRESSTRI